MISRSASRSFAPPSVLSLSNGPDISPARGEIETAAFASPIVNVTGETARPTLPISPLAGEMSGRTEGGGTERSVGPFRQEHRP
ncbi:hypothetical protein C7I84_15225 [Mesorhizobium ephedrae]|uniref:Propionyl-coenzyme A carboxylase alpha polypeptide n=1 Tax=Kumtagia ephedrae TaxID=2116701 RepID=A0A2P7S8J5_9HYPH|nr:hypothetical protein C7I84_15225 [Mesorhizobium ephedrae]